MRKIIATVPVMLLVTLLGVMPSPGASL